MGEWWRGNIADQLRLICPHSPHCTRVFPRVSLFVICRHMSAQLLIHPFVNPDTIRIQQPFHAIN